MHTSLSKSSSSLPEDWPSGKDVTCVGSDGAVLRYDASKLRNPMLLLCRNAGSVNHLGLVRSKLFLLVQYAAVLITSILLALWHHSSELLHPDSNTTTTPEPLQGAAASQGPQYLFGHPGQRFGHPGQENLEDLGKKLDSFVVFIFAGYLSLILTRWWALRSSGIGAVTDACGSITRLLSTSCVNSKDRKRAKVDISRIYTMAVATLELMKTRKGAEKEHEDAFLRQLTDKKDKKAFRCVLQGDNVDPEEGRYKQMENAQLVWGQINVLAEELMRREEVPGCQSSLVHEQIAKACEGFCTQRRYLCTQLPFRYVYIIHIMANVDMALYVFFQGPDFVEAWYQAEDYPGLVGSLPLCLLSITIFPLMYNGLLGLCLHLDDPMEEKRCDLPLDKGLINPTNIFCRKILDFFLPDDAAALRTSTSNSTMAASSQQARSIPETDPESLSSTSGARSSLS